MSTLLIRLAAPLQSWGVQSHFTNRDTNREPSKSGVIGLICAALGRPRRDPVDDLAALRFGVRLDRPGTMQRDFHIVQDVLLPDGSKTKDSIITNRFYLADAAFLAGLEGDLSLLQRIQTALQTPVWPLYLGRKAFAPAAPVWMKDGLRENQCLEEAFRSTPWIAGWPPAKPPDKMLCVFEDINGAQLRNDVPLSFAERSFGCRRVSLVHIEGMENDPEEVDS